MSYGPHGQVLGAAEALGRNAASIMKGWRDPADGVLFDSFALQPGDTFVGDRLFTVPIGGGSVYGSRQKTLQDTNMQRGQQLPPPYCFLIRRLLFTFNRAADDRDVFAIAENTYFRLFRDDKAYLDGLIISLPTASEPGAPLRICEFCHSVYIGDPCPGCGARQFRLSSIGPRDAGGRRFVLDLGYDIYLAPMQQFFLQLDCLPHVTLTPTGHGGSGVKLWCHLEGLRDRSVW